MFCIDVHIAQQAVLEAAVGGTVDVTWSEGEAKHAKMGTLAPLTIKAGGSTTLVGSGIVVVDVTSATSLLFPASLASVDAAVRASDQFGESVFCMDVHTAQQAELVLMD